MDVWRLTPSGFLLLIIGSFLLDRTKRKELTESLRMINYDNNNNISYARRATAPQ
jgi:hypothetical protein